MKKFSYDLIPYVCAFHNQYNGHFTIEDNCLISYIETEEGPPIKTNLGKLDRNQKAEAHYMFIWEKG